MMLWAQNVSSVILILVLWWMVHENATGHELYGKTIASGYAMWALLVMAFMFFGNVPRMATDTGSDLLRIAIRCVSAAVLALVALRLKNLHGDKK